MNANSNANTIADANFNTNLHAHTISDANVRFTEYRF